MLTYWLKGGNISKQDIREYLVIFCFSEYCILTFLGVTFLWGQLSLHKDFLELIIKEHTLLLCEDFAIVFLFPFMLYKDSSNMKVALM